ncbi:MAG: CBS domain-containing protein [Gemmatimonadales bacterium]|jgi:CBS domain-containing protein|nr:MAG: CBS domain-containing protein [Gemmatimonadales bacterium]
MNALELMTPDPTVVAADDTISHAARLMRTMDVGMLPVVDDSEHLRIVGVLTDRDIVVRCLAEGHRIDCKVRDHMTTDPLVTVGVFTALRDIANQMERYKVRRLPVVNREMTVHGIVTQADLARQVGPDDPELIEEVLEKISTPGQLLA